VTDSPFRISRAALVAAFISSPAVAAGDNEAIQQQLNALQQALAQQQDQIAQQQQEIERLRQQLVASSSTAATTVEKLADDVQQAKLAAQDAPRVAMTSARPTITSADGRSSIALRSVVQLDAAHYGEDSARRTATISRAVRSRRRVPSFPSLPPAAGVRGNWRCAIRNSTWTITPASLAPPRPRTPFAAACRTSGRSG
jgi:hypothetical protein